MEADESDGTLVKYRPEAAVILNISKDHKSTEEITKLFETLVSQSPWTASNVQQFRSLLPCLQSCASGKMVPVRGSRTAKSSADVGQAFAQRQWNLPLPGEHNTTLPRGALRVRAFGSDHGACKRVGETTRYGTVFAVTTTKKSPVCTWWTTLRSNTAKIAAVVRASGAFPDALSPYTSRTVRSQPGS